VNYGDDLENIRGINVIQLVPTRVAQLVTSEQSARRIAALVAESQGGDDVAVALVDTGGGLWRVAIHFRASPDRNALRALIAAAAGPAAAKKLRFARITAKDWIRDSLAGLAPVAAGRFVVHGAHDRAGIPANRIGIEIEAALAFGTGHHGTTRGCLLALDRICKQAKRGRPGHILDLGTGSGVLAIAAARALHRRVLATDIDADAVGVARANARLNRAARLVEVVRADGVAAASLHTRAPLDLVFANILLGPLLRFASPLRRLTGRSGRIVLSGIVPAQANAVIAAYRPLALEWRLDLDGWTTLVFVRRTRPGAVARHRPA
jgi:ribosomal protein L11 methyltransferase